MDYIYGAPRQPPAPPTINQINRSPVVPEVSLFENSFNPLVRPQNRLENPCDNVVRREVRFNRSSNCNKENHIPQPHTLKTVPDLNGKTFKQIYMANVPDRHLDLSIFEPSVCENKAPVPVSQPEKESFANYAEFRQRQSQKCNTNFSSNETARLRSIGNVSQRNSQDFGVSTRRFEGYKPSPVPARLKTIENVSQRNNQDFGSSTIEGYRPPPVPKQVEICTQTDNSDKQCTEIAPAHDEPTIRDLYKIIQQQNEQIMLLQRQVNNLKTSIRQPEIDLGPHDNDINNSPTKKSLFSFDVKATSFEFSFRPQQNKFRKPDYLEPKIQEIVENSPEHGNSLRLEESLDVGNSYVSEVPSIDIKMDEYHSSDDEEEPQTNNIGLTFYNGLMDQVNNVLQKVQTESECNMGPKGQDLAGQTMKAVKQTTLQHLKEIGVNLPPIQESSEVTRGSELNETDISCAVQQLLMKYLPEDKLAKAINKPKQPLAKFTPPTNTEFSFATLQYMQKYNLIGNKSDQGIRNKIPETNPKILDVTALKLQPKLM